MGLKVNTNDAIAGFDEWPDECTELCCSARPAMDQKDCWTSTGDENRNATARCDDRAPCGTTEPGRLLEQRFALGRDHVGTQPKSERRTPGESRRDPVKQREPTTQHAHCKRGSSHAACERCGGVGVSHPDRWSRSAMSSDASNRRSNGLSTISRRGSRSSGEPSSWNGGTLVIG